MKRTLLTLLGAVALTSSLSALAGPDWTVIDRARAAAKAQQAQQQANTALVQEANAVLQEAGKAPL
ncbi:hypothetical protein AB4120_14125 [Cupriavidus sp. 2KB_3]|uniref:hypothetical protein n=1 Tax=Cupriavidus sp. 2KB_3 TaxID=3232980 RepID=UPI003F9368D0